MQLYVAERFCVTHIWLADIYPRENMIKVKMDAPYSAQSVNTVYHKLLMNFRLSCMEDIQLFRILCMRPTNKIINDLTDALR